MQPHEADLVHLRAMALPIARQLHPEGDIHLRIAVGVCPVDRGESRLRAAAEPRGEGDLADQPAGLRRAQVGDDRQRPVREPARFR